jgi:hypothetical protein
MVLFERKPRKSFLFPDFTRGEERSYDVVIAETAGPLYLDRGGI